MRCGWPAPIRSTRCATNDKRIRAFARSAAARSSDARRLFLHPSRHDPRLHRLEQPDVVKCRSYRSPAFGPEACSSSRRSLSTPGEAAGSCAMPRDLSANTSPPDRDRRSDCHGMERRGYNAGLRNTGSHLKAMPDVLGACDEAAVVRWPSDEFEIPPPEEVARRMRSGRTSKLRHPSAGHSEGKAWPDRRVPLRGPRLTPMTRPK